MSLHSPTGCIACKSRRHKCDKTQPECKRCVRLGLQCHYIPPNKPNRAINRPSRPTPSNRPIRNSAKAYQSTPTGSSSDSPCSSESWPTPPISQDQFLGALINVPAEELSDEQLPNFLINNSEDHSSSFDFSLPSDGTWHVSLQPSIASVQPGSLSSARAVVVEKPPILDRAQSGQPRVVHSDQRTPILARNSSAVQYSTSTLPIDHSPNEHTASAPLHPEASGNPWLSTYSLPPSDGASEEEDPEGIGRVICDAPWLDCSVESNALAFVLQSYARWITVTSFEPLRIAYLAKHDIAQRFSCEEGERRRLTLFANVFRALGKTFDLNSKSLFLISSLSAEAHQGVARFKTTQSVHGSDTEGALQVLQNMMDTIFIHFHSSPFLTILHLMRHTAPVFRHACPEPVSQFPNLPNMFLEPGFYRRYFAAIDVLLSVTSARPMLFRYDVTCPPSFFNQEYPLEYGLEWAHGTPDQFIVLFAWINGLVEDSLANGVAVDPECVARIEDQVKNGTHVRDFPNSDPVLRIGRVVVREYWRQAVLVYLYMALCGAHAKDPRVERALKRSMRLIEMTRPARNPDAFLVVPMIVVGVAAHKQADRDTLHRRMLGTRECSVSGLIGSDCMRVLIDLWARTDEEGRPAVWSDFRASHRRVLGT